MEKLHRCYGCQKLLPIESFNKSNNKMGRQSYCRICQQEYGRRWAADPDNKRRMRAYRRRYDIQQRAKKSNK